MSNFKILFTDTIHEDLEVETKIVKDAGGKFYFGDDLSEEEFWNIVEQVDAIVTVYKNINKEMLERAKNCKIVVRTGIGFNNIDIKAAGKLGIYVSNVPDYCLDEVADHTVIIALAVARKIPKFDKRVRQGNWTHDGMKPIYGFKSQAFGLLGFGHIARYVAKRVKVFGFKVIAYDPFVDIDIAEEFGVKLVDIDTLFTQSDFLSLHAPLTNDTKHVVNETTINKMKENAIIINTARGPLIDEKALYNALVKGKLAGAALDVLEYEPPKVDNPLFNLDNVILTPHVAFYSDDSGFMLRKKSFEEAIRVAKGYKPLYCVNKRYLRRE